ncbi:putative CheW protein [Pseudomonas saudimassiliensis]|uniref:Putative CheW protein n=1 Tax=Pseudomonas saudimassiliensis TaxID=1461581 RepID=A0A078M8X5_9PSED|nr:CheW domain-containing protein [Pseudomonas saudimassiliensis]CEA01882.1 putative CheW protein [Pseudomonas saudimassiliensis]CEF25657.1 putative CheW protein [Pseudomonas saudimassiliensis]
MNTPLPVQHYVPEQTIQSYLDALLQEAAVELALAEPPAPPVVEMAPVPVRRPEPLVVSKVEPAPMASPLPEPEPEPEMPPPAAAANAAWREAPFEALLFDVGGLTLAVPLVSLGSIHSLDGPITPLFGQPDWFLGLLPTQAGNLRVLDTARWIMPERYTPDLRDTLRFVISVQGHEWGMAVHGVSQSIRLDPSQIKWRSGQGKRPWLAGTLIDQMCALVDVDALATLITAGKQTDARLG